jgi:hypothetical protein
MASHSRAWDNTDPANSKPVGEGAQETREFKEDIDQRMQIDHVWSSSTATGIDQDGLHQTVTLPNDGGTPAAKSNRITLYSVDVASKAEALLKDEDNNAIQLTSGGSLGKSGQGLKGNLSGATVDLTGDFTTTGDILVNTSKFVVNGTTGAFSSASTFVLSGNMTQSGSSSITSGSGGFIGDVTGSASSSVETDSIESQTGTSANLKLGLYDSSTDGNHSTTVGAGTDFYGVSAMINTTVAADIRWQNLLVLQLGESAPASGTPYLTYGTTSSGARPTIDFNKNSYAGTINKTRVMYWYR